MPVDAKLIRVASPPPEERVRALLETQPDKAFDVWDVGAHLHNTTREVFVAASLLEALLLQGKKRPSSPTQRGAPPTRFDDTRKLLEGMVSAGTIQAGEHLGTRYYLAKVGP